ncbi:DUF1049 domain-containing protein [Spirochaeta cellobiosiphila]|uniref:DUF1049 domain-containing protein n=1 Tax=Spirochaeta cellobiosiphila TaxID=504483 RepID=UPI0003F57877|nr:DUF1049 domain-containing protein [Spirochaeta cellobiosiphila]
MPWRMFMFFISLGVIIIFIALNLENRVNISFGFYVFQNVPVFIALFFSFLFGGIIMIPFTFKHKVKSTKKVKEDEPK